MYCPTCAAPLPDPPGSACPSCGQALTEAPRSPYAPPQTPSVPPPVMPGHAAGFDEIVPWEDGSRGLVDRFFSTIKLVITDPRRVFLNLRSDPIWPPLAFGWIAVGFGSFVGGLWQLLLGLVTPTASEEERAFTIGIYLGAMIAGPILAPVTLFITAGIYHLGLMLFGAAERGFAVTFRVVCYAYGLAVFQIIPICGGIVAGIWTLVLWIWGGAMAHRTSAWRTALGYFVIPLTLAFLFLILMVVMFGLIGASLAGS